MPFSRWKQLEVFTTVLLAASRVIIPTLSSQCGSALRRALWAVVEMLQLEKLMVQLKIQENNMEID